MIATRALRFMLTVVAVCVLAGSTAQADAFVFAGAFAQDDDVRLFNFSVTSASNVRLYTTSYAGGTNADGTTTPGGGFDPILTLFSSSGVFIARNDQPSVPPDSPLVLDAAINRFLPSGSYLLAVTQYFNFAQGDLADGFVAQTFLESIRGSYTGFFFGVYPNQQFVDLLGNQRTNQFTVNISGVGVTQAAPVPEPMTVTLLGTGLVGIAARVRRRRNG